MTKKLAALLLLTFVLGACASSAYPAQGESTQPPAGSESTAPAESTPPENSGPAPAAREAVLSEFENEVVVRAAFEGEFIPAEIGFIIQQGGGLQTGETGRARLDLKPEGTIVRVAPNSAFTLPQIVETDGEPKTTLDLFFGKIFILLNGGSVDVQTPSGVASVRGSLLSVSFDPVNGRIQAACLEGHCALQNEGGNVVEIEEGESAFVEESGIITEVDGIDRGEISEWLVGAPELGEFLEVLPDPEAYPNIPDLDEFDFDPETFFEEPSADDGLFPLDEEQLPAPEDFSDGGGEGLP